MKTKYVLTYAADTVSEPLLWKLVKDYDLKVNILRASISPGQEGNLLVEFDVDDEGRLARAVSWIESTGVTCVSVSKRLSWKEEACVDCGSCTGVCFSGAIAMDRATWKLAVTPEACVACGSCVTACPFGCFALDFGD